MRLWYKGLIPALPNKHLLSQWRECCLIAKSVAERGTPNHILVNKVIDYSYLHLLKYGYLVINEMRRRKLNVKPEAIEKFDNWIYKNTDKYAPARNAVDEEELFKYWHTFRYGKQCMLNLQEKYDCGMISHKEWQKLLDRWDFLFPHDVII